VTHRLLYLQYEELGKRPQGLERESPADVELVEESHLEKHSTLKWGSTDMIVKLSLLIVLLLTVILSSPISSTCEGYGRGRAEQCSNSSDERNDQQLLLEKLDNTLKNSIPAYAQFSWRGFFVYDLTDPTNKYIPGMYAKADSSLRFINHHVYHFAPIEFIFSHSHIAVLEDGRLKVFKSINCKDSNEHLADVINYVKKRLKKNPDLDQVLTRIRDYRTYGLYVNTDSPRVPCEDGGL